VKVTILILDEIEPEIFFWFVRIEICLVSRDVDEASQKASRQRLR
jgi:hypothetical protein